MAADHVFSLQAGTDLLEFRLVRLLGHGGFGITYLAEDLNLREPVAIKEYLPNDFAVRDATNTVLPKTGDDAELFRWGLEAFLSEARTLARFRHPNIMRVRRFFQANGTGYLVMDYAEGATFDKWLQKYAIDEQGLRGMLLALVDGLSEVHQANVLHRDIKPSNIIIRPNAGPLLIDFGAARDFSARRSRSMTAIVSAGYAPLEQYSSAGQQGPWTDIYALGAVAYRAAAGKPPPEAVLRVRNDPMVPAVEIGKGRFSPDLLSVIDWALTPDERDRPQSTEQLRDALEGHGEPRSERRSTRIEKSQRARSRDHRRLLKAVGAAAIALGIIGVAYIALRSGAPESASGRKVITVDANGSGDVKTIAAALAAAPPGALIRIKPGRYLESLTLDKTVSIEGDAAKKDSVRIEPPSGPCAQITGKDVSIGGLTLSSPDNCLVIAAEGTVVEDVAVTSAKGTSIVVKDRADPKLTRVDVLQAGVYGVSVESQAKGTYRQISIANTGEAGMRVLDEAEPDVEKLQISKPRGSGLLLARGAKGQFKDVTITGAGFSSMEVAGAFPKIEESKFVDGEQAGIYVHSGGGGTYTNNSLIGHKQVQIAIEGPTQATFKSNTLERGASDAIYVTQKGNAKFDSNIIKDNRGHGATIDLGSTPNFAGNRFANNKAPQIQVSKSAKPELTTNSETP